jgi:hypothetical protein
MSDEIQYLHEELESITKELEKAIKELEKKKLKPDVKADKVRMDFRCSHPCCDASQCPSSIIFCGTMLIGPLMSSLWTQYSPPPPALF